MTAALTENRLSPADIEQITGVPPESPWKQRNRLLKQGIKAFVNARKECVTFWCWVEAAALPVSQESGYIQPANDEITPDFRYLRAGEKEK